MASTTRPSARSPGPSATHWRYCTDSEPAFDPVVFDEHQLAERGALIGAASAGRGNTHFFRLGHHELVLRHYRRGGLIRHLSETRYVWTGLARTRAVREFDMLRELLAAGLSVSPAYACCVVRDGLFWEGSLVTHKLPGCTLAEALDSAERDTADAIPWAGIGTCIASLHRAGVEHADLNAHNIMFEGGRVFLIDFDRARRRSLRRWPARWQQRNIERLRRSLTKLANRRAVGKAGAARQANDAEGFRQLEGAWRAALTSAD